MRVDELAKSLQMYEISQLNSKKCKGFVGITLYRKTFWNLIISIDDLFQFFLSCIHFNRCFIYIVIINTQSNQPHWKQYGCKWIYRGYIW